MLRSSLLNRQSVGSQLLLPGFELAPARSRSGRLVHGAWVPVPVSLLGFVELPYLAGLRSRVVVRSVASSVLSGCKPAALGGEPGLFGSKGLLGALCAPWPLSPVSRRRLLPLAAALSSPFCTCREPLFPVPPLVGSAFVSAVCSVLGCRASSLAGRRSFLSAVAAPLLRKWPNCVPPAVSGASAAAAPRALALATEFLNSGKAESLVGGFGRCRPALALCALLVLRLPS